MQSKQDLIGILIIRNNFLRALCTVKNHLSVASFYHFCHMNDLWQDENLCSCDVRKTIFSLNIFPVPEQRFINAPGDTYIQVPCRTSHGNAVTLLSSVTAVSISASHSSSDDSLQKNPCLTLFPSDSLSDLSLTIYVSLPVPGHPPGT